MAYTLDISLALGSSQTGLSLSAQLVDTNGNNVGGAVTTGFVEIGAGNYLWHYAAWPDGHRGGVKFSTTPGGVLKAFVAINPEEGENTDVKVSTRAIVGGSVSYAGPVALTGAARIVHGDDYSNTDGRALEWTTSDSATWPDLTGATVTFTAECAKTDGTSFSKALTVVTPTGSAKKVRLELTAAETGGLALGRSNTDIQATLASARKVTLVKSSLTVESDYSP